MHETVSEISRNFISDRLLKDYSYLGQRKKLRSKDYDNVTRLIISATLESLRRVYREVYGKDKLETDAEKKLLHDEVEVYFTKEYIKQAEKRYNRSLKWFLDVYFRACNKWI